MSAKSVSRDTPLTIIRPNADQPRRYFDKTKLQELADSMSENGLLSPILLRDTGDDHYTIVHGERRYRAAGLLGWQSIAAHIRVMTDEEARMAALVENIQRDDLSPIEEAVAYKNALTDTTQEQLAKRIGKTRTYIASKLRLLKLPAALRVLVDHKLLTEGHAKQLMRLRSFYGGVMVEPFSGLNLEDKTDQEVINLVAFALRPLDGWYGLFIPDETSTTRNKIVRAAIEEESHSWQQKHEAWSLVAMFLAVSVVYSNAPVTTTKNIVDMFIKHVCYALLLTKIRGEVPSVKDVLEREEWYGYRSDLRHARLTTNDLSLFYDHLLSDKHPEIDMFSWLLPSGLQRKMQDPDSPLLKLHHKRQERNVW